MLFVASLVASAAGAETITLGELACLPSGENGVVTVRVDPPPPAEVEVRLYFRRMNLVVEDFYFTVMKASGAGTYWGIFPQPEPAEFPRKKLASASSDPNAWAKWWRAKEESDHRDPNSDLDSDLIAERASLGKRENRDWMETKDEAALESWFGQQRHEPAEYFVALHDPSGQETARSPQQVVPVRDDCTAALTPQQAGMAMNLTVGETSRWQVGKPVFHWECTGVIARVDSQRVLRGDEACRACVVGWWPLAAGAGVLGLVAVTDDDPDGPQEISPSRP
jgi:hypothetical protein